MPGSGGDGYSLLRRVRGQAPEAVRDLPAVALTAHARDVDWARALDAGFDMHVSKPVDVDELVVGIGTLIAGRRRPGRRAGRRPCRGAGPARGRRRAQNPRKGVRTARYLPKRYQRPTPTRKRSTGDSWALGWSGVAACSGPAT